MTRRSSTGSGKNRASAPAKPAKKVIAKNKKPQPSGCSVWISNAFAFLIIAIIFLVAGLWFMWGRNLPNVADLDILEFSGQTRVYDRAGKLVGTLNPSLSNGGAVNRDLLKLNDISTYLQKAVITSEDRRFYEHNGVDLIGVARGIAKGILKNDLEGGSSITQQVVKNTLLADMQAARTPERKFKEAILAYQLDRDFDKNKILNAYLNIIYWGDGGSRDIIGAGGAAKAYFAKEASELNLAESVYLAIIIPAPNRRYKSFLEYRPLMKDLLGRMVEDKRITEAEAKSAWKTPIYPAGWRIGWNADGSIRTAELEKPSRLQENLDNLSVNTGEQYKYAYYLRAVEQEMLDKIGRKALYSGGKIYTGMDIAAQEAAEQASLNASVPYGATLGIALINPRDGEALALVGGKLKDGERPSDWNNATQARRQVGSSIKPLLYTLALQKGWKQSDTVLDAPIEGDYQPANYNHHWTGRYLTMRYSLDHSLNLPTVRIGQEIGMGAFESKLREMDLVPPSDAGLSLSIGTLEASPLQLAAAYATFANGGVYFKPSLVRSFEDKSGNVLYKHTAVSRRVWDEKTAWLGLDMLRGVVNDLSSYQGGLAVRAKISGWEVGGKTGTTNEIKDLWFAGVTPDVAGAVWVGRQEAGTLPYWATSGAIPTPVWQEAVSGTLLGRAKSVFTAPEGITYRVVRKINMAFRTEDASKDPVARDGSRSSSETAPQTLQEDPQPADTPAEATPEPIVPEPVLPATDSGTSDYSP